MLKIYLKPGRERPVLNGHPWVFSGAIEGVDGSNDEVAVADVFDARKHWLARGFFNPASQIRLRLLTWRDEAIDGEFIARRLAHALAARSRFLPAATNAFRLVNGEGDFLPGLVVDRYDDFFVCQFIGAGMERLKDIVIRSLVKLGTAPNIYEKSEGKARAEEGLGPSVGVLHGDAPPERIEIAENGRKFAVDIVNGQKTGFFLDQRDNRLLLSEMARGAAVLNCFAYSGGFSIYAMTGGARSAVSLDSSRPALELAEENFRLNGLDGDNADCIKGDAFAYLKESDALFDIIVLDPPSLAPRRTDMDAATGGYKFLNLHALKHLTPGGLLLTFSCSQHLSFDLFQKVVFGAAVDARRKVAILRKLGQPLDHPVSLHHPEGEYLKGLVLRVLD